MRNKGQIKLLLGLITIVILFHFSIIIEIIPYNSIWGGRLQNDRDMYTFEIFSILINLYLGFILLIKAKRIKPLLSKKVVDLSLWIFLVLFILNTVGNLFARTYFEKTFAILTLLFSVFIWNILKSKDENDSTERITQSF